jgi:polyisoprenoid-binding protein YceI
VALAVELAGTTRDPWGHERAGFTAKASIDRRDFGLTWNLALEAGGVLVGERVEIEIEVEVEAVKQGESQAAWRRTPWPNVN